MALAIKPSLPAPGTRPGSPVKIIDTYRDMGHNSLTVAIPISTLAEPGDVIVLWLADGGNGALSLVNFYQEPANYFTYYGSTSGIGTNDCQISLLYHVVQEGDPGGTVAWGWSFGGADQSWELVATTFRYANPSNPINAYGTAYSSGGDGNGSYVQSIQPGVSGSLIYAAMAFAPNIRGWTAPNNYGALPSGFSATSVPAPDGWYGADGGPGNVGESYGLVPSLGLVTGIMDEPAGPYQIGGGSGPWTYLAWTAFGGTGLATGSGCGWAVSINPVEPPGAPTLSLSQSGGSIDAAGTGGVPLTATWIYQPSGGNGPQIAWLFGREHADGTDPEFWNADLNIWVTEEYWNFGSVSTYIFPAGAWVNDGQQYRVYAGVMEGNLNYKSALSPAVEFTADDPPSVIPLGPVGSPGSPQAIEWAPAFGVGGASETAWQVRIYDVFQYSQVGFGADCTAPRVDSGQVSGADTSWVPTPALRGGTYYRAYVRIQQSGGQWSPWEYTSWYAAYNNCAQPTITVSPDTDPVTGQPRAKVSITGHDPITLSGTTYATVFRYDPERQQLVICRFGNGIPIFWSGAVQTATAYDYDMKPNTDTTYQAQVYSTSMTGP